jgi:hypothetical protein
MAANVKVGEHVHYNDGGKDSIGHVLDEESGPEEKALIQTADGGRDHFGYREPTPGSDKGMTFWLVK